MKRLTLYILLFIITVSCSSTIKKSREVKNQPIIDYIETLVPKDSVIYIHEHRLPYNRAVRTMETGTMPDPVYEKYAVNFLKSEYYKKDAWKTLTKKYANDTIDGKWLSTDFKLPHKMITHAYQKELYQNKVVEIILNRKRIFTFSGVMYYDNNRYAIFSIVIGGNIILSGRIEDALIIMEKKGNKWVYVDKMLNDEFINY